MWWNKVMSRKASLLDYAQVLTVWKKKIIVNFFIVCLVAAGISLIIPKTYRSYAVILPSGSSSNLMSNLGSLMSDLPAGIGMMGGLSGMTGETGTYLAIINSRSVKDTLIDRFNLMERYKTKTRMEARKILSTNLSVNLNDEGTLSLSIAAKTGYFSFGDADQPTKRLTRDMAKVVLEQLERIHQKLKVERAKNNREFIETRYNKNLSDLQIAENELNAFQKEYGAIALPEQTEAQIEAVARLRAMLISKQIELELLEKYYDQTHPDLQRTRDEFDELQKKYQDFFDSKTLSANEDSVDIFLPINELPDIGLKYARLYREVMIQQKIQEIILPLYEQAKIQEAKQMPAIQVIDPPILPERKESPKRSFIVIIAGLLTLLFVLMLDYLYVQLAILKVDKPDDYTKLKDLSNDLFSFRK
ncbi:hypothetical protein GF406_24225 [candidate division KSB1 bacterium]|nr:hypothetical protein [candidate division KSB1 bacterium]